MNHHQDKYLSSQEFFLRDEKIFFGGLNGDSLEDNFIKPSLSSFADSPGTYLAISLIEGFTIFSILNLVIQVLQLKLF